MLNCFCIFSSSGYFRQLQRALSVCKQQRLKSNQSIQILLSSEVLLFLSLVQDKLLQCSRPLHRTEQQKSQNDGIQTQTGTGVEKCLQMLQGHLLSAAGQWSALKAQPCLHSCHLHQGTTAQGSDPPQPLDTAGGKCLMWKPTFWWAQELLTLFPMGLWFVFALGKCGLLCCKFQNSRASPKAKKKGDFQKLLDFQHQPCSMCAGPDANQALWGCLDGGKSHSFELHIIAWYSPVCSSQAPWKASPTLEQALIPSKATV